MDLQTRSCLIRVLTLKYFNNSYSVLFVCLLSFTLVKQLVYYCDSDGFGEAKINNKFSYIGLLT